MPSTRCVAQDCSNESDAIAGISLHISPKNKTTRANWVRFVRTKRANFIQLDETRFMVCSEHFSADSFERAYHIKRVSRRLKLGAVPTVWKGKSKLTEDEFTPRQRRKVSKYTVILSVFIYEITYLISFHFILLRVVVKIIKDILQEENKTENSLENIHSTVCKY